MNKTPTFLLFLFGFSVFLVSCCSSDTTGETKKVVGVYYPLRITSDFDEEVEVAYFERGTKRDKNLFFHLLNCFEYEQVVESKTEAVNAFNGATLNIFVETGGQLAVTVSYNEKSKLYATDGTLNVAIRRSDFP